MNTSDKLAWNSAVGDEARAVRADRNSFACARACDHAIVIPQIIHTWSHDDSYDWNYTRNVKICLITKTLTLRKVEGASSLDKRIDCVDTALCVMSSHVYVYFMWPHLHIATIMPLSDLLFRHPSYYFLRWADA